VKGGNLMVNVNNCVPKLSQKELLAIKDQLDAEKLTISKFQQYAADFDDPGLKSMCSEMVKVHKNHYNTLVKHMNC
jgi:rubrerythrin